MQIYKLTSTQKAIAISSLLVAACVSLLVVSNTPQPEIDLPHVSMVAPTAVSQQNQIFPMAAAEMPTSPKVQTMPAETPKVVVQGVNAKSWQMGDVKTAAPKIQLNEKISEYTLVQLEQHPAQFPAMGEQIQLPMLNGQTLVANVQSTTTNPNGDYSWSGHLQGYGDDYPVIMTYGERSIFATITTPEGSYTMESIDGVGWLYKNPAEIELSNPGMKDFLEVTEAHK